MADHTLPKPVNDHGTSSSKYHHGLVLLPPPSDNPRDPLRWPKWIKIAALLATAIANFTANFAGTGLSVAAPALAMQYHKSANDVNGLLSVAAGPSAPTPKSRLTGYSSTCFFSALAILFGCRWASSSGSALR